MRKKSKERTINVQTARVQGYHEGRLNGNYAFEGFESNKVFTSDRTILLDAVYHRIDGKALKGFGLEIETECWTVNNSNVYATLLKTAILSAFPEDLFKLQRDGSLTGGESSAEIITQIMTKEFIRNQYPAFKAMFQSFEEMGISCTRSGHCGMHTNISNACFGGTEASQEKAIRKLYYFINKYYSLSCGLFSRDPRHTGYCGRMPYENAKTMNLSGFYSDHGCSFNLGHYREGRVEIRLVGGQKNFATFRNTIETVFCLIDAVKRCSWDEMDDFTKVFKGCNKYVLSRLELCKNSGLMTDTDYNVIARMADTETEYI